MLVVSRSTAVGAILFVWDCTLGNVCGCPHHSKEADNHQRRSQQFPPVARQITLLSLRAGGNLRSPRAHTQQLQDSQTNPKL